MRIKRDIINKFKEWKDAENPCRGKGRKLCQWKKYCCVQRTLPTQEPHTFLVSQFTAKLRNVSLSLALSRVGYEMVEQIIISYRLCNESCGYAAICHKNNFTHTNHY